MQADHDGSELDQIRAAWRAACKRKATLVSDDIGAGSGRISDAAKPQAGGVKQGGTRHLPHGQPAEENETDGVAGKNLGGAFTGGGHPGVGGAPVSGSCPSTKQLRLRLPHDFAQALKKQPASMRGTVFMCAVFGQIGSMHAPSEFVAGVEQLQRIRMLLWQSLEWQLPDGLPAQVQNTIQIIDRMCRAERVGYVSMRLHLPCDYADALLTLSLAERERIIRLAVSASAASISLLKLLSKASVLRDRGKRLIDRLYLGLSACPEAEIREVLDVFSQLLETPVKGGRP
jgi:hypothetical protein